MAPQHKAELNRQLDLLLEAVIIRKSYSPYASPCLFAPKADGSLRLCVDYRQLNLQKVRDRFPTPTDVDLVQRTWGAKLFSKIDLMSDFHQICIREEHVHKTAFVTEDGHYEWVVCPFGLSSTPSCFQRLMSTVLEEHIRAGYVVVYVDDICIFTKTDDPHEHLEKLEKVLDSLRQHDLLAKGSKCSLFRTEMEFLGFLVSADGTRPTPSKVEAVVRMAPPETVSQLRSFLGMMNFFASHIAAFSERASPLTDLLRGATTGRQRLLWSPRCEQVFRDLKSALISTPVRFSVVSILHYAQRCMWTDLSRGSGQCCYNGRRVTRIRDPYVFYHESYKAHNSNMMLTTLRLLLSRLLFRNGERCCMAYPLKYIRIIEVYTISSHRRIRLSESCVCVSS